MKEGRKSLLLGLATAMVTTLGIIGSTTGTIAWWAYSRAVTISYVGTSVKKSLILSIGLVDNGHYIADEHLIDYGLSRETSDGNSIVWTNSTTGISIDAIREYLLSTPYAINRLSPVSSWTRALDSADDLSLRRSPDYGDEVVTTAANPSDYVKLPFAYKVIGSDGNKVSGHDIWLTDVSVQASGENIDKAVRVFVRTHTVQNDTPVEVSKFLMNPTDESDKPSYTVIGGLLDLDGDGYYDVNRTFGSDRGKEYVYGDTTGATITHAGTALENDSDLINVNQSPYTSEASTFYGKHEAGSYTASFDRDQFGRAYYQTFNTVKPCVDNLTGNFCSKVIGGVTYGIPVATTESDNRIGYADLTIYLEGWDHAIIDQAVGYSFNLGLQFEVNPI